MIDIVDLFRIQGPRSEEFELEEFKRETCADSLLVDREWKGKSAS